MKNLICGIAICSTTLLINNAHANGPYLLASAGQSDFTSELSVEGGSPLNKAQDADLFTSIGFGYSLTPNFALEIAYSNFGEIEDDIWEDFVDLSTKVESFSAAAKFRAPLSNNFSLTAKVGVEQWHAEFEWDSASDQFELDDEGTDTFFGIGAELMLNKQLSLVAQYEVHKISATDTAQPVGFDIGFDIETDIYVYSVGAKLSF